MRTKDTLKLIEEVAILYQYLYMSDENNIVFNNGMTDLQIRMDDQLVCWCKNLSFPNLPEMRWDEEMTLATCLGIIEVLKNTQPTMFSTRFTSRWDELKTITQSNMALNFFNK